MAHRTKNLVEAAQRSLSLNAMAVLEARTLGFERTTLQCFDLRDTTPLGSWAYRLHLLLMAHRTKDLEAAQRSLSLDAMAVLDARTLGLEGTTLQCSGQRDTTPLVDCGVCDASWP